MQYEEYVQFGLISMGKVHMGHMCLKCVFIKEYIGYFTFGIHCITFLHLEVFCSIFHETTTWSSCQWAAHWLTAPGRSFVEINQHLRTIENLRIMV